MTTGADGPDVAGDMNEWEVEVSARFQLRQHYDWLDGSVAVVQCHAEGITWPASEFDSFTRALDRARESTDDEGRVSIRSVAEAEMPIRAVLNEMFNLRLPAVDPDANQDYLELDSLKQLRTSPNGVDAALTIQRFVASLHDWTPGDADILASAIFEFPIPLFGSPPSGMEALSGLLAQAPVVAGVGTAAWTDHPVLAFFVGVTGVVIWVTKPAARVFRRALAEKASTALGVPTKPEDED